MKIYNEPEYPSEIEITRDNEHLKKIREKWNELREIAKIDLKDPPEFDFHLPSINMKWLGYRSDWINALLDIKQKANKIEKDLTYYYRTNSDIEMDYSTEKLFIKTDPRYIKVHDKCKRIEGLLQFIEGVLKAIENKYYLIKEYNIRERYLKGSLD